MWDEWHTLVSYTILGGGAAFILAYCLFFVRAPYQRYVEALDEWENEKAALSQTIQVLNAEIARNEVDISAYKEERPQLDIEFNHRWFETLKGSNCHWISVRNPSNAGTVHKASVVVAAMQVTQSSLSAPLSSGEFQESQVVHVPFQPRNDPSQKSIDIHPNSSEPFNAFGLLERGDKRMIRMFFSRPDTYAISPVGTYIVTLQARGQNAVSGTASFYLSVRSDHLVFAPVKNTGSSAEESGHPPASGSS